MPKFDIEVELSASDGNAFSILGRVQRAIWKAGGTPEDKAAYFAEATNGDYDHLLQTTMKWVHVI